MKLKPTDPAYRKLQGGRFGEFIARCYPNASKEDLTVAMLFGTFAFVWNDEYELPELLGKTERIQELNDRALDILLGATPTAEDGPMMWILADIHEELMLRMPQAWLRRFVGNVDLFFRSSLWEAVNRYNGEVPSSADYIVRRRETVCLLPMYDLVDMMDGICLPTEVRTHPTMLEIVEATLDSMGWANDIISAQKEDRDGDFHNLVLILEREDKLSRLQAVQRVIEMHDARVRRFIELEGQLTSFGADLDWQVNRYIHAMKCAMKANLDWSASTDRYLPPSPESSRQREPEDRRAAQHLSR
jgi:hypothetical protein